MPQGYRHLLELIHVPSFNITIQTQNLYHCVYLRWLIHENCYYKNPKITPEKCAVIILKFEQPGFTVE